MQEFRYSNLSWNCCSAQFPSLDSYSFMVSGSYSGLKILNFNKFSSVCYETIYNTYNRARLNFEVKKSVRSIYRPDLPSVALWDRIAICFIASSIQHLRLIPFLQVLNKYANVFSEHSCHFKLPYKNCRSFANLIKWLCKYQSLNITSSSSISHKIKLVQCYRVYKYAL